MANDHVLERHGAKLLDRALKGRPVPDYEPSDIGRRRQSFVKTAEAGSDPDW